MWVVHHGSGSLSNNWPNSFHQWFQCLHNNTVLLGFFFLVIIIIFYQHCTPCCLLHYSVHRQASIVMWCEHFKQIKAHVIEMYVSQITCHPIVKFWVPGVGIKMLSCSLTNNTSLSSLNNSVTFVSRIKLSFVFVESKIWLVVLSGVVYLQSKAR